MRHALGMCAVIVCAGAASAVAAPGDAPAGSPAPPPAPAAEPEITQALGLGVGQVSGATGDDVPLVLAIHGEVGRTMVPAVRLVVGIDVLVRVPEPDFEEGMAKPRSQGGLTVGGRIEPLPRLSFAGFGGLAVTDYVVDRSCNFLVGCRDEKEVVFGLVVGATARVALLRRAGRWKDIGIEAHVTRAQYMTIGGVMAADIGLVFGEL